MRLGHRAADGETRYDPYKDASTPQCECWNITGDERKVRCTNHIGNDPTRCSDGVARCERHAKIVPPKVLAGRSHLPGEQKYFGRPL